MLKKTINYLLLLLLFFLPFQTRWVYASGFLNGGFWEYGSLKFYATEILLWLTVILFLAERLADKNFRTRILNWEYFKKNNGRLWCCLAGLLFLIFILWHSLNFWISLQYVDWILGAACLAMVVISRREKIHNFIFAFWGGGVIQGAFAVWQFLTQQVPHIPGFGLAPHSGGQLGDFVIEIAEGRWLRAYGSFGSPNALGIYLAALLVVGLILYLSIEKRWLKILLTAGQLIILAGLVFSFSRGAWVATGVGLIFLMFIIYSSARDRLKNLLRQVFYYLILAALLVSIFFPLFFSRFNFQNRLEARSVSERGGQFSVSYQLLAVHPWFGFGPGTYTLAAYKYASAAPAWAYQPVHNVGMLILVEWGAIGLVFLLFIFYNLSALVWKKNRWYFPPIIILLIAGLFDHWSGSMFTGVAFSIIILALGLGDGGQKWDFVLKSRGREV